MQPLEAGDPRSLGEYRLLRRLGAGGMGRVYLGRSPGGRTVAVKVVHPHFATDDEFRVRFRREVESARRVGGDWTAPVLDADPDAGMPWVATGYVAGPSLQQAVAEHGPMPEPTVRALGAGLAEALDAVHALGLVHRDVKPSNVLLALDGPRLIDFGIARATDGTSGLTSTGASVGSPGYMSPERVLGRGPVAAPSDVFSLGAVLAYAATGTAPFPGDSTAALLYNVVHEEPDLAGLSDGPLCELIRHCLEKRAGDRPPPGAVVRTLADGTGTEPAAGKGPAAGAVALTRAGWLPAPLVEQVSRSAVALLDMEAEATAPPAAAPLDDGAPVSGLVPFPDAVLRSDGSPATGPGVPPGPGGQGTDSSLPRDHVGPAWRGTPSAAVPDGGTDSYPSAVPSPETGRAGDPGAAESSVARPTPSGSGSGGGGTPVPGPSGSGQWWPGSAPGAVPPLPSAPAPAPDGSHSGRGRVSLSASATTGGGGGGRSARQLSCTLVLSVAGAMAAALLTFGFVLDLMPGGGGDHTAGDSGPPAAEPSPPGDEPTSGDDGSSGAAGGDSVPEAFLGTWKGQLTTDSGLPAGLLTVTVSRGEAGEQVITGTFKVAIVGEVCPGRWTLKNATGKTLTVLGTSAGGGELCTEGRSRDEFRLLPDGRLRYASHDEKAGNPAGTLRRAG